MNADVVKVFLPISETEGNLCYVTAHIVQEVKRGHYAVYIDDEDWPESVSRERIITLKSLPGMDSLPMQNEDVPETGVDDMASLNFLHEASILDNIRRRFRMNLPYTYTGDICIATNPYHWLDIYTADLMEQHKEHLRQALPPHAYATSATAYRGLRDFAKCQSILVSGESGAGKTETVKILMGHLAHISGKKTDETVDRVLKANPLMESFGNAKTMRNDNSSRFGKFVQLEFDEFAFLKGSRCVTYLLEKTRVIGQNDQERSFHIFYQLLAASSRTKKALKLSDKTCEDFMYLNRGDTATSVIEGVPDAEAFVRTMEILALLGIENSAQLELLRILSGILHLGQIQFIGDSESSKVDALSADAVAASCEMLGLAPAAFVEKLTSRKLVVERNEMKVNVSVAKALEGRDALAKETYNRVFAWLVSAINRSTMSNLGDDLNTRKGKEDAARRAAEAEKVARRLDRAGGIGGEEQKEDEGEGDSEDEEGDGEYEDEEDGAGAAGWGGQLLGGLMGLLSLSPGGGAEPSLASSSSASSSSPKAHMLRPMTPTNGARAASASATPGKRARGAPAAEEDTMAASFSPFRLFTPAKPTAKGPKPGDGAYGRAAAAAGGRRSSKALLEKKKKSLLPPKPVERLIGLLDIFGFENFQMNYFEQICINFANERLQRRFTQDVFVIVQEEYKREGLQWETIKCMDNSAALELLEGRLGIIDLLNEESMRGQGNDLNFLAKMKSLCGQHSCYVSADVKMQKDTFAIKHYAGKVTYCVSGFVDRNNDTLSEEIRGLVQTSTNQLLKGIFSVDDLAATSKDAADSKAAAAAELQAGKSPSKLQSFLKQASVTQKFKTQLGDLMGVIEGTTVQYVRCIKPNARKSPEIFDRKMVVEQLRCAGMIDAVKISRSAYPYRVTHAEFAARFEGLRSQVWMRRKGADTAVAKCQALLEDVVRADGPPYLAALHAELAAAEEPRGRFAAASSSSNSNGRGRSRADDKVARLRASLEDRPYEVGKTKVYFSAGLLEMFEDLRGQRIFKHILAIQRVYRGHRGREVYRALLHEQMKKDEKGCFQTPSCKVM